MSEQRLRDLLRQAVPEAPDLDPAAIERRAGRERRNRLSVAAGSAAVFAIVAGTLAIGALARDQGMQVPPSNQSEVVPWKPLPATHPTLPSTRVPASPSPTYAAGARSCDDGDLRLGPAENGGAAAGTSFIQVDVLPVGHARCRLTGYPEIGASYRGHPVDLGNYHQDMGRNWHTAVLIAVGQPARFSIAIGDVQWCTRLDHLEVTLPGLSAPLAVSQSITPTGCDTPRRDTVGVSRVVPAALEQAHRISPYDDVRASGDLDLTVPPGQKARFQITLTSKKDLVLAPCPDYTILTAAGEQRWALNCSAVPHHDAHGRPYLPAGVPVDFAMEADTGDRSTPKFLWSLDTPTPSSSSIAAGVLTVGGDVPDGHLEGTALLAGGPSPDTLVKVAEGKATATSKTASRTVLIDAGQFAMDLPPGTYRITVTSPQYDDGAGTCQAPHPVTVRTGGVASVTVRCQRK